MLPALDIPYQTYCENAAGFVLAQPLNVASHLAFVLVAALVFLRRGQFYAPTAALGIPLLLLSAGAGAAWHCMMNGPSQMTADISALVLCVFLIFVVARHVFYMGWFAPLAALCAGAAMVALHIYAPSFLTPEGAALLPFGSALIIGGIAALIRRAAEAGLFLMMAGFWAAGAVMLVSVDILECVYIPAGTHFIAQIVMAISFWNIFRAVAVADNDLRYTSQ